VPTPVVALEGISCQNNSQRCRGLFHCSQASPDLFKHYTRWDYDFEPYRQMWLQERKDQQALCNSYFGQAASFFNMLNKRKCPFNNGKCTGQLKMCKLTSLSEDGKSFYIGCSAHRKGDEPLTHTYLRIPATVDEDILHRLVQNVPSGEDETEAFEGYCSCIFSPRIGFKKKHCCEFMFLWNFLANFLMYR